MFFLFPVGLCQSPDDSTVPSWKDYMLDAENLLQKGQSDKARIIAERALHRATVEEGENSLPAASCSIILGKIFMTKSQYAKAQQLFDKAMETANGRFISSNQQNVEAAGILADALGSIGDLLHEKKEFEDAEKYYRKAIEIREDYQGTGSIDLALSLNDYAVHLHELGSFQGAEKLYLSALNIVTSHFGGGHKAAIRIKNNLARLYDANNRNYDAIKLKLGIFFRRNMLLFLILAIIIFGILRFRKKRRKKRKASI